MRKAWSHSASSWRIPEARSVQPSWILGACLLLAMLLLEVWQQSMVASLSLRAGRASDELKRASIDMEWTRAQLDRGATRAEVGTLAFSVGMRPGEAAQVVWLPSDYLEEDRAIGARPSSPALLAVAGRAFQSIVPEAKARGRRMN